MARAGAVWLLLQALGGRVLVLVSQIILAHILLPSDFGLLSLSLSITSLVQVVASFGVDEVLLQRHKSLVMWASPAFWTGMWLSTIGFIAVCLAAPVLSALFQAHEIMFMIPIIGLAMPFGALSTVSSVQLKASLRFRDLAQINLVEQFVTQLLTIALALSGLGPLSFALPMPIAALVRSAMLYRLSPLRIRPSRAPQYQRMLRSGALVLGNRLITALVNQGSIFLLGLSAIPSEVGLYYFAFRLSAQPVLILAGTFSSVFFPAFAKLGSDPARQNAAALRAARLLGFVLIPYSLLQAFIARPVMHLVFGPRWDDATSLVAVLSIGLGCDCISWVSGTFLSARGEYGRALKYVVLQSSIFFLMTGVVVAFTSTALPMAVTVSLYYVFVTPLYTFLTFLPLGIGVRPLLEVYLGPLLVSVLAYTPVYLLTAGRLHPLVEAITTTLVGSALYTVLARQCLKASWNDFTKQLRGGMERYVRF